MFSTISATVINLKSVLRKFFLHFIIADGKIASASKIFLEAHLNKPFSRKKDTKMALDMWQLEDYMFNCENLLQFIILKC